MAAQPFAETLNLSEGNLPAWAEKFCRGGEVTVWPGAAEIADMFTLLLRVKSEYRQAYFKLKAQEILLFLAMYGVPPLKTAESCEERYMEIIKRIHAQITGSWQEHYTIEQLAREYSINDSVLKKVFKMVYGKPVAQYMKEYRMKNGVRQTGGTVYEGIPHEESGGTFGCRQQQCGRNCSGSRLRQPKQIRGGV